MRKPNFTTLIKEELVKRFESVVREEIRQHNLAIESNNAEVARLGAQFEDFKKGYDVLRSSNKQAYDDTLEKFQQSKTELEKSFQDQRSFIKESAKHTEDLLKEFSNTLNECVKVKDFSKSTQEAVEKSNENKAYLLNLINDLHKAFTEDFNEHVNIFEAISSNMEDELFEMDNMICSMQNRLNECKTDSKGVLEELQIYKKNIFIIEKNIENLYTVQQRITKRLDNAFAKETIGSDSCPK